MNAPQPVENFGLTQSEWDDLVGEFDEAQSIVFFTGAGISTESGIADFRSPGGIWTKMKPIQFSDFVADEATRMEDWRRRFHFQAEFDAASPNAGHVAVAQIMGRQKGRGVITQNIDGLHQRAGVQETDIIEIHGNGTRAACLECQSPMALDQAKTHIDSQGSSPTCTRCGGLVKAAVISFGQPMPQAKMVEAETMALECDLFVVLGSSLVVQPAASLPIIAQHNGAKLLIINRDSTPLDKIAHLTLQAPIGPALSQIVQAMEE